MTDKIESMLTLIMQGKTAEGETAFNQIISQKASEAIDNLRADVTDRMFNQGQYNESFGPGALAKYAGKKQLTGDKAGQTMPNTPSYGNKRDHKKIDLHANGKYIGSTTWSPNVKTAVQKAEEKWPEHKGKIKGFYAESVEAESLDEEFFMVEGGMGGAYGVGDPRVAKSIKTIQGQLAKGGIKQGTSTSTVKNSDGTTTVTKTDANGKKTVTKG